MDKVPAIPMDPREKGRILDIIQSQRSYYKDRQAIIKHIRRIRALRIDTRTPRTFQRLIGRGVRSPLPWSLVQTINGMIVKKPPVYYREPLRPRGRVAANTLAATCWPLMQSYSHIAHKDLYYQMCDQLAGDGLSVVKFRRVALKDYPEWDKATEEAAAYNKRVADYLDANVGMSPFRLSLVDPQVFWPDRADEPEYVVESGRRSLTAMLKNFNVTDRVPVGETSHEETMPSGLGLTTEVSELWSADYCYIVAEGEVYKFKNDLGFIPYTWRSGMSTSIPDPSLQAVSTVFPFYAMDPYINTLLTSLISWAIMSGMPTAVIETMPVAGQIPTPPAAPTDLPLGQMVDLGAGKKLSYISPDPIGREVVEAINMMMGFYDRAGVTTAARGMIGSRTPGLTFTSALEAAGDMVGPIKEGLQGLLEDIQVMTWKAVEALDFPIDVTGFSISESGQKKVSRHKITKQLIGGNYDVHCSIEPLSDQQMVQRGMHAAFMKQHELWAEDRAMLYSGVENPEQERQDMMLDKVRKSPLYQQEVMKKALEEDPEQLQKVNEAAAQGVDLLGNGAVPENPGGPGGPVSGGQVREGAPSGGGRPAGMPRQPTGPRQVSQGQQFPA